MVKAEYVMPGVIQVTANGPMLEQDDEEWFRNLEKEVKEGVARANASTFNHHVNRSTQPSDVCRVL